MQISGNLIGQKVGDYRIDALLGEGGMGVVYRGVHEILGQTVAIKMLHPALMADDKLRARFVREAQALARLNHPNIVRLMSFFDRDDTCFIVMEYIEGKTIDRLMIDRGIIPPAEAADYFCECLAAMHYAHSLQVIHRDIKPSNICVLNGTGMVKVLDFGTAKMIGAQRLTQEGMTLGTLIYMSPEQITGKELDHRSDIYSLGVTLYEMVTGKLPHDHDDEMELVRAICKGVPEPPSVHYKHLPKRLEQIIMKAIEKKPEKRFQTADDFLRDLKEYQSEEKFKERKLTPPSGLRAAVPLPPEAAARGAAAQQQQQQQAQGAAAAALPPVAQAPPAAGASAATGSGSGGAFLALAGGAFVGGLGGGIALLVGGFVVIGVAVILVGLILAGVLGFLGARSPGGAPAAAAPVAAPNPGTIVVDETTTPAGRLPEVPHARPPGGGLDASTMGAPPPAPVGGAPAPVPPSPGATAYLFVLDGPDKGRSWPLPHGAITIGRGPHNTIVLNDPGVSTSHAQIGFDGSGYVFADLQSRNGSYVNNNRIQRVLLSDKDVIVVGTTQMSVTIGG